MFRLISSALVLLFVSATALGADLTPDSIIGKYKVSARAGFMKVYLNFNVVNSQEFEVQRTYSNGTSDEVCNGDFKLNSQVFRGNFTCPSNRQKNISFNIDFKDKTTEDLVNGTTVVVTSSMAPGRSINAYVIKK